MNKLVRVGAGLSVLGAFFAACSSAPTIGNGTQGTGAGSEASAGGAHGSGASSGVGGTIHVSVGSGGAGGTETCAGETSTAEVIPLDIYLMLDSSGSMLDTTGNNGTGPTKWDAVTQALGAFFSDPASQGLGVGLQHFPALAAGVPESCTAQADCPGSSGPCVLQTCAGLPSIVPCSTNSDCFSHGAALCVPLGECGDTYCAPANNSLCSNNSLPCAPLTSSFCLQRDSCLAADYAAPMVEIGALPGAAGALAGAIAGLAPGGATPTAPALSGAVDHARAWAQQSPTHTVVVVLATDGLPTECAPEDIASIAQIAAAGAAGAPPIKTFAIGVFAPDDITAGAQANLDQIAAAGGTSQAFLVDTSQNVEAQFLAALAAIRGSKLACEYLVPPPGDAGSLDYLKVNVEWTPPGTSAKETVGYVGGAAGCDPSAGGWYYDVDPTMGATPAKLIMCPATCGALGAAIGGEISIRVGCKTILAPPPK